MKKADNIFYLMQLAGGTFPSGGFSQSWGLETYVSEGKYVTADNASEFIETLRFQAYTTGALKAE